MQVRVVGIATAGNTALDRLISARLPGLDFAALDTDQHALHRSRAPIHIPLGPKLTRGLGAGGNPRLGERAAEESADELFHLCRSADVVLIAAGLGGALSEQRPAGARGRRPRDTGVNGYEPINNGAERALRPAVLWRKGSFGSDSEAGSRFAERLLTVVASGRQQGRPLLDFLVAAGEAALQGRRPPSSLPEV
jgi:hypothetical protein